MYWISSFEGKSKMKHLILALFAATLSLSASATDLNLSKSNADDTERASKINTSKSNLRDGVKDHGANFDSERSTTCHTSDCAGCKYSCRYMGGGCLCIDTTKATPDSSKSDADRAKNAGNSENAGNARNLNPSKSNVDRTHLYPSRSQPDKTKDMHCSIIQNIKARTECQEQARIAVSDPRHTK